MPTTRVNIFVLCHGKSQRSSPPESRNRPDFPSFFFDRIKLKARRYSIGSSIFCLFDEENTFKSDIFFFSKNRLNTVVVEIEHYFRPNIERDDNNRTKSIWFYYECHEKNSVRIIINIRVFEKPFVTLAVVVGFRTFVKSARSPLRIEETVIPRHVDNEIRVVDNSFRERKADHNGHRRIVRQRNRSTVRAVVVHVPKIAVFIGLKSTVVRCPPPATLSASRLQNQQEPEQTRPVTINRSVDIGGANATRSDRHRITIVHRVFIERGFSQKTRISAGPSAGPTRFTTVVVDSGLFSRVQYKNETNPRDSIGRRTAGTSVSSIRKGDAKESKSGRVSRRRTGVGRSSWRRETNDRATFPDGPRRRRVDRKIADVHGDL